MEKPIKSKKHSLKERRLAQPSAVIYFSDEEKSVIKQTVAKDLDIAQTSIFFYQCQALGLNPLLSEICAVVYKGRDGNKMSIQVMRDGFLKIAHRSGKFAGMESGVKTDDKGNLIGWAKVYHKDFQVPLYQEADSIEYSNPIRNTLWQSKPKTMIKKVAESMALRKAFNVSGVYASEEMDLELAKETQPERIMEVPNGHLPATDEQKATLKALGGEQLNDLTRQQAVEEIRNLTTKK